jgi:hypothetical protein
MAKHKMTQEEKFVTLLIDWLSDLRLDLDLVGLYFVQVARKIDLLRLKTIVDAIEQEQEEAKDRSSHYKKIWTMGE